MSYQEKCEKLYRDNIMLKDVLKIIASMSIDVTNVDTCIKSVGEIKAMTKTILAVVDE